MGIRTWTGTTAAVVATAVTGAIATDPDSAWYRGLDKPSWQPPPVAFPAVWTPLYALIAVAGSRALDATDGAQRDRFGRALAANLVLNAGWTALFFRGRNPGAALAEIALLNVSNLVLLRRAWRADRAAGVALLPYVAWTGFATALNAAIATRNPG